jgi:hypothetical protein
MISDSCEYLLIKLYTRIEFSISVDIFIDRYHICINQVKVFDELSFGRFFGIHLDEYRLDDAVSSIIDMIYMCEYIETSQFYRGEESERSLWHTFFERRRYVSEWRESL